MSYTTIHTKYTVGELVYFHNEEDDTVQRGVVVGIEARSSDTGWSPKWSLLYTVAHKHASDPPQRPSLIREEDLFDDARHAWPEIVTVAEEVAA
jgi:hypothetical protein